MICDHTHHNYLTNPSQIERKYNIVAACDVISEMNKYIDRVNEIFKVSLQSKLNTFR